MDNDIRVEKVINLLNSWKSGVTEGRHRLQHALELDQAVRDVLVEESMSNLATLDPELTNDIPKEWAHQLVTPEPAAMKDLTAAVLAKIANHPVKEKS